MPDKEKIKLLCTLGPSSFDRRTISRLDALGVDLFRINLSHTDLDTLEDSILTIKQYTQKPLCLDTEGAQVRTGKVENDRIYLQEDREIELTQEGKSGTSERIQLIPSQVMDEIQPGDLISVDFDSALLLVFKRLKNSVLARVVAEGWVGSSKAVNLDRQITLPALSPKDEAAIQIGLRHGLRHFALSFANARKDVEYFRQRVGQKAYMICKIESTQGVQNVDEILELSDAILIDRGDLSREEPLEKIPFLQKFLISKAKSKKKPVYVATNLLESMLTSKKPTRAEVNDVMNTLLDGADGLVLAAETAIGQYPIQCASMVTKLIKGFMSYSSQSSREWIRSKDYGLSLAEPHGGSLVDRFIVSDPGEFTGYRKLPISLKRLRIVESIALGVYSPLEGFMNQDEIESVLKDCRLPRGDIWPVPIVLPIDKEYAQTVQPGEQIALVLEGTQDIYALLDTETVFRYDSSKMAKALFDTGEYFLSGKVQCVKRPFSELQSYEITPRQARNIFESRGWSWIAAWSLKSPSHFIEGYALQKLMEKYHWDGVFLQPEIPPTSKKDSILTGLECLTKEIASTGKALMGIFYENHVVEGPRKALFKALCAKNFGCTHFALGFDPDLKNKDKLQGALDLFDASGDLGIIPIFATEFSPNEITIR